MNKCAVRAARVRARRRATMCCKRGQPERPGGVAYSRVLDVGQGGQGDTGERSASPSLVRPGPGRHGEP